MDLSWFIFVSLFYVSVQSVIDKPIRFSVAEERKNGTLVGTLVQTPELRSRHPPATLDQFRFHLDGDQTVPFAISTVDGEIRTTEKIDRESLCTQKISCVVTLTITVQPLQHFAIFKVEIEIIDINDHRPDFGETTQIKLVIAESAAPGLQLTLPPAKDYDSGELGVRSYELVSRSQKFKLVTRNQTGGQLGVSLVLTSQLDREIESSYLLKIVARDGGTPVRSAALIVDVEVGDHNDNKPQFSQPSYAISLPEDAKFPRIVMRVHAEDADAGDNGHVTYSFAPRTVTSEGDTFSIDSASGEISLIGPLDYETNKRHVLSVMATDLGQGTLPVVSRVMVTVLDVNDHAPEVMVKTLTVSQLAEVEENQRAGMFVAHITVNDADEGVNGQSWCTLTEGDHHFSILQLSAETYKLVTTSVFDRETLDSYTVMLTCQDRGDPVMSTEHVLPIKVTDDNDHSPQIAEKHYSVAVKENNKPNAMLIQINATDADIGENGRLRFTLRRLDAPLSEDPIAIDSATGMVYAVKPLDRENRAHHFLRIIVSDHGEKSRSVNATLNITVIDINDVAPRFVSRFTFHIAENSPPMTYVGTVNASDSDSPRLARITYDLEPTNREPYSEKFAVKSHSGTIIALLSLDREEQAVYHIPVEARNRGYPGMSSVTVVTIHVEDVNDNPPVLLYPTMWNRTVNVSSQAVVNDVVMRIIATDPDAVENSTLAFSISNGNDDEFFSVDRDTGALAIAKDLSSFSYRRFHLVVVVKDRSSTPLSVITDLNVVVNRSAPFGPNTASSGGSLLEGSNLVILIGAVSGIIFIVIAIAICILLIRWRQQYRQKRDKRFTAPPSVVITTKSNGGHPTSSTQIPPNYADYKGCDDDCADNDSSDSKQCMMDGDDGLSVGTKCFVKEIPHLWVQQPPQMNPPTMPLRAAGLPERRSSSSKCRQRAPQPNGLYDFSHYPGEMAIHGKHGRLPYASRNYEMVEMLDASNGDRGSETGSADSGRGISEEGDSQRHLDTLLGTNDCRDVSSQSDTSINSNDLKPSSPVIMSNGHPIIANDHRSSSFHSALESMIHSLDPIMAPPAGSNWHPPVPPAPADYHDDHQRALRPSLSKKKVQFADTTTTFSASDISSSAEALSEEDGTTTSGSYAFDDDINSSGHIEFMDYTTQQTVV